MVKKLILLMGLVSALSASDLRKDYWETTDYVWNFGIVSSCDVNAGKSPVTFFEKQPATERSTYLNIKPGDIVWMRCIEVNDFCKKTLPSITCPFVLVICDGDESFPSECGYDFSLDDLLLNDKVVHIFAQNCDYKGPSPKISPIPIGIDFHTIAYKNPGTWGEIGSPKDQEACLKTIQMGLKPTYLRKKKAYVNFQLSDTTHGPLKRHMQCGEDRKTIFKRLVKTKLIDYGKSMRRTELWKKKGEYAFSISPYGNGLDCHRTWEDLALGCIVVVKTSPIDSLYEGLPVIIVKDWAEVTKDNMEKWLQKFPDASTNPIYKEKLTHDYWMKKIRKVADAYKIVTVEKKS
jgi:hypothetical protein